MLPLKHNVQLLAELPVRKLPDIMTVSQERKRMPPSYVRLFAADSPETSPNTKHMIIVTEYECIEKIPGVFCSVYRSGSLSILR